MVHVSCYPEASDVGEAHSLVPSTVPVHNGIYQGSSSVSFATPHLEYLKEKATNNSWCWQPKRRFVSGGCHAARRHLSTKDVLEFSIHFKTRALNVA
jgi:hypothetical protein